MTNKSSAKKHGLAQIHILRKKSKLRNRKNKANARILRAERFARLDVMYKKELAKIA